jgi:hypothetical protein
MTDFINSSGIAGLRREATMKETTNTYVLTRVVRNSRTTTATTSIDSARLDGRQRHEQEVRA